MSSTTRNYKPVNGVDDSRRALAATAANQHPYPVWLAPPEIPDPA